MQETYKTRLGVTGDAGDMTITESRPEHSLPVPRFDTKVVVLVGEGLAAWQELNVTAFLMSGIATSAPDLVGEPYRDADATEYLPMLRQPVVVLSGDAALLQRVRGRAAARQDVSVAVYTRELFATGHDAANRAAMAAVASGDLDVVGIGLRGPRNVVDRIAKGARPHV
jgi:hypothetical protein